MIPIKPIDPSVTLVYHFLERSALLYPDKVAFIHGPVRATYSEINDRADNLARYLLFIGVQKGDRVALLMENCVEYVVSYYGIMKTGAVAVPLNGDLKPEGLRYAISDLEAKVLISNSRFEKVISASSLVDAGLSHLVLNKPSALSSMPYAVTDFSSVTTSSASGVDYQLSAMSYELSSSDLASIIYTSGSTGGPKGVMLSHKNIVDNTYSICQYLRLTEKDIQMVVLPFFYVMGKSLLNTHIAVGGTVVVNNQFAFPVTVLKEMIKERVTGFSGVPSTFAHLLHRSPLASMRDQLISLRYVSQAGGHMARAVKERLRQILPDDTEIFIMYGATEAAARLSYLDPSRFPDKTNSIGKAIPGVEFQILRDDGNYASPGEVGELVAKGTNIMKGYWRRPEATAAALSDGWYHTGDQAYVDEEGFLFLVGRKDDLLKAGGHRINPQDVEEALMESCLVLEAVVLGLPDDLLGKRLVALTVPANDACTPQEIMAFCADKLPKFKIPSEIRFIKSVPKKSSGKIDRRACAEIYG
jgi:long-chain acyl-CoA synthetase